MKGSQTMKFGQLIECNKRNILFENHAQIYAARVVLDLLLFFKKALYGKKASFLRLNFNIVR